MDFIIVMDTRCQIIARYQMMRAIAIRGRIISCSVKFKQNFNIRFLIINSFVHTITPFLSLYYKNDRTATYYQDCGFLIGGDGGICLHFHSHGE